MGGVARRKLAQSFSGWHSVRHLLYSLVWLLIFGAGFWLASVTLLVLDWRSGKLFRAAARDPPFVIPSVNDPEEGDQEDADVVYTPQAQSAPVSVPQARYDPPNYDPPSSPSNPFSDVNRYPVSASAFTATVPSAAPPSIPAARPSIDAYGAFSDPAPSGFGTSSPPPPSNIAEPPRISRTMQYADPYAAVRASVAGGYTPSVPPSYEDYTGYR